MWIQDTFLWYPVFLFIVTFRLGAGMTYSFTRHSDGDTLLASHINELQAAVENLVSLDGDEEITGTKWFTGDAIFGSGQPWIDVTHSSFGVIQNNESEAANNITKINLAMEAASGLSSVNNARIGVYFPSGITWVKPVAGNTWLNLYSNVDVFGSGFGSIVKVSGSTGNYYSVCAPNTTKTTRVDNCSIHDITFDQNSNGNSSSQPVIASIDPNAVQFVIALYVFKNIHIYRVNFDTCSGINTVVGSSGSTVGCEDYVVEHCRFKFQMIGSDYDNSAVYLDTPNHSIINNRFFATIGGGARGAFETHNGPSICVGNRSWGYQTGCNIVNSTGVSTNRNGSVILVSGNVFAAANTGITLWSITSGAINLSSVKVSNNVIDIRQVDHNSLYFHGIRTTWSTGSVEGTYKNISITDNIVSFQTDTRSGLGYSTISGVGLVGANVCSEIDIRNNLIFNSPVRGINLGYIPNTGMALKNITVEENVLVNCGNDSNAIAGYRASIGLQGPCTSVHIRRNRIVDTVIPMSGYQSIWVDNTSSSTYTDVDIRDNTTSVADGGFYDAFIYVSEAKGIDIGRPYERVYATDTFPPATGYLMQQDIIRERLAAGDDGTDRLYRVTVGGSFGTLTGITANTTSGSPAITLSSGHGIRPWDRIQISGLAGSFIVLNVSGNNATINNLASVTVSTATVSYTAPTYVMIQPRITYRTSAPVSGTWERGDQVLNLTPSAGSPIGWICATSGTPGTFVAMPNLA